jgi:hypothetical protein
VCISIRYSLIYLFWYSFTLCRVVNFGMLCLAFYEAWKARNLSTEFQESDYIFRALATILVSFLIGVPVLALSKDPNTHLFIGSALTFIAVSIIYTL